MSTEPHRILQRFGARGARKPRLGTAPSSSRCWVPGSAIEISAALRARSGAARHLIGLGSLLCCWSRCAR